MYLIEKKKFTKILLEHFLNKNKEENRKLPLYKVLYIYTSYISRQFIKGENNKSKL